MDQLNLSSNQDETRRCPMQRAQVQGLWELLMSFLKFSESSRTICLGNQVVVIMVWE